MSGVHSAGLSTTVSPAASAGPIFQVASMSGAFHGVMSAATPDGSQLTWFAWPRVSNSGWCEFVDGPVGEEPQVVRDARHDAAAVAAQQRAVVHGLEVRELLEALLDEVGDAVQDRAAAIWAERGPSGERGSGGRNREVDLACSPAGDITEQGAVDRRMVGEGLLRRDALAADEVPWIHGDTGYFEHHRSPSMESFGY